MRHLLLSFLMLCLGFQVLAQELEFQVTVTAPRLQTTDPKVFENLESTLVEFLNSQKWTDDVFEQKERIRCNIQLTIKEEDGNNGFTADMAIQAVRPVFGSAYLSPLLTHVDRDVSFEFQPFQPLQFNRVSFNDNLTSVLGFYAFIILGLDYDSFAPLGGDEFFNIANNMINSIPANVASQYKGWKASDGNRNRYWIIENYSNPRMRPLRQAFYQYHLEGLDMMHKSPDLGRAKLYASLLDVEKASKAYPNAMVIQMFANAKSTEIVEIFKEGTVSEKPRVHGIMTKIDAAGASKYIPLAR